MVSAPTGAGKTAIAEAAAIAVLARGQHVIYTTPLKALSNQKLAEMRERFGHDRVGLQTGDGSLNAGALFCLLQQWLMHVACSRRACLRREGGRKGGGGWEEGMAGWEEDSRAG